MPPINPMTTNGLHSTRPTATRQAQWQRQMEQENDDEQASMDAANASYAADAAQAAANV